MMYVQLCWLLAAAVACSSAQLVMHVQGISAPFQTKVNAGNSSTFRDACACLGYDIEKQIDRTACLHNILYSAEQVFANDDSNLLFSLGIARTVLEKVLYAISLSLADVTCGDGYVEGHVVVHNDLQQGLICDDGSDHNVATSVCRSLGFQSGEHIYVYTEFVKGSIEYDVVLDVLECPTNVFGLDQCTTGLWGDYNCTSAVSVRCYSADEQKVKEIWDVSNLNQPCMPTVPEIETTIQRRINNSVSFDRDWVDYVNGFGDAEGNYWMGLNDIHRLTTTHNVSLYINIHTFEGEPFTLKLQTFSVGDAESNYALRISGYSQSPDRVTQPAFDNANNGMMFTTRDRDNDQSHNNCASDLHKGGWWYGNCGPSNLNGNYEGDVTPTDTGIVVKYIDTTFGSSYDTKAVKSVEMILRTRVEE